MIFRKGPIPPFTQGGTGGNGKAPMMIHRKGPVPLVHTRGTGGTGRLQLIVGWGPFLSFDYLRKIQRIKLIASDTTMQVVIGK